MPDIEDRIVYESALTPQDIHDRYRVLNGAIYGLASHGKWFGAFKPANRSPDLGGLYLAGGAAHPGPGMPMVLMSGWIAADTLDRDGVARAAGMKPAARPAGASKADEAGAWAAPAPPALTARGRGARSSPPAPAGWWRVFSPPPCPRWAGRHSPALRLSRPRRPPEPGGRPVVVVLNHPSWWDPLLGVVLAELFAGYRHYVPIDA